MGGLGGNKCSDNTDIMIENERGGRGVDTGGGLGEIGKESGVKQVKWEAWLCKNEEMKHIK